MVEANPHFHHCPNPPTHMAKGAVVVEAALAEKAKGPRRSQSPQTCCRLEFSTLSPDRMIEAKGGSQRWLRGRQASLA